MESSVTPFLDATMAISSSVGLAAAAMEQRACNWKRPRTNVALPLCDAQGGVS